MRFLM